MVPYSYMVTLPCYHGYTLFLGIMMFNLDSCTLYGIAEAAVAEFVKIGLLQEKNKDLVMNALLLKHR